MPITVYQPSGGVWSPGMAFRATSSSIPVDATQVEWLIHGRGGPQEQELFNWLLTSSSNEVSGTVLVPRQHPIPAPERGVTAGTSISIEVSARDEVGEEDVLVPPLSMLWDPTMALWSYLNSLQAAPTGGGFTDADRAQLEETNQLALATRAATQASITTSIGTQLFDIGSLFNWASPEFWGTTDLSGGTTCARIEHNASLSNLFGVSVLIDSYPEWIEFRTPDNVYSFRDLAVLTFVKAGVIVARHGIHTLSHHVSPLPGTSWYGVAGVQAPIQPADYFVIVDWLPGVCGRLTGSHSPFG